jgi:hypothetical protein
MMGQRYSSNILKSQQQKEVTSQLHAMATVSLGKDSLIPTEQEAGWAPELIRIF